MADGGFGCSRGSGYGACVKKKAEGSDSVAHGESSGADGGAGEVSERAGRRGESPATEEGDDSDGGVTGRSDKLPSMERRSARWRSC